VSTRVTTIQVFQAFQEGDRVHFRFEFTGGPVDRRNRQLAVGRWSKWVVYGDYTRHPEPSDDPDHKPHNPNETKPRPYKGPMKRGAKFNYGGGIEDDPTIDETYAVRLYFTGGGGHQYFADVDMRVTGIRSKIVYLQTVSNQPQNLAPEGEVPIIVPAGEKFISLEDLKKIYVPMALDEK
jgi:hypothetical protein